MWEQFQLNCVLKSDPRYFWLYSVSVSYGWWTNNSNRWLEQSFLKTTNWKRSHKCAMIAYIQIVSSFIEVKKKAIVKEWKMWSLRWNHGAILFPRWNYGGPFLFYLHKVYRKKQNIKRGRIANCPNYLPTTHCRSETRQVGTEHLHVLTRRGNTVV